jgi:hypothetical protein
MTIISRLHLLQIFLLIIHSVAASAQTSKQKAGTQDGKTYNSLLPTQGELQGDSTAKTTQVKEGTVVKNGVSYRVFKSGTGAIYLPAFDHFSTSDLEKSLCTKGDPSKENANVLLESNYEITENVKIYGALIVNTIKKKCDGATEEKNTARANPSLDLEIGVQREKKGPNKRTDKIYNRNLGPNINFKSEF